MIDTKEKTLPFLAMIVLLIGISATIYVHAQQSQVDANQNQIIINNEPYDLEVLFQTIAEQTIETDDGEKTGIPTDELIKSTSVDCPSCHQYTFIAPDGYQKTVTWDHMQTGVFTSESRVFFPDLAHAFWVRDITEIKVE